MIDSGVLIGRFVRFLLLSQFAYIGFGDVSGNDLFASISSLESLWDDERQFVTSIEKILDVWHEPPRDLSR